MNNLKLLSFKQSLYFGIFLGIIFPAVVLRAIDHGFSLYFLVELGILSAVLTPIIISVGFIFLLMHYRCSACKGFWCYVKEEDHIVNCINHYYGIPFINASLLYKIEEHVVEYKCKKCDASKTSRVLKRVIEKE